MLSICHVLDNSELTLLPEDPSACLGLTENIEELSRICSSAEAKRAVLLLMESYCDVNTVKLQGWSLSWTLSSAASVVSQPAGPAVVLTYQWCLVPH